MMIALQKRRVRGVALIKAMLVVALATSVAVAMVSRQQFDIRRTANLLQADQAGLYALGVEDWAAQILRRDRQDNATDHNKEEWASILPPIPVDGGSVAGYIEDLQGRFNINNLVVNGVRDEQSIVQFRRLLEALKLAPSLADAVVDWLDGDIEPTYPGGAEDDSYLQRQPPYRSANTAMVSPSELLLVEGVDKDIYAILRPHVVALPGKTPINVNTATDAVLMSVAEGLSEADVESLISARGEEGFDSVESFLQQEVLAGRQVDKEACSVASGYFLVVAQIQFGNLNVVQQSLLQRDDRGTTRTILRVHGTY